MKPREIKSRGLSHDHLACKFIKDPCECIRVDSWDSHIGLTLTEAEKLANWLKKAVKYLKNKRR